MWNFTLNNFLKKRIDYKWISHDTAGGTQYQHFFVNDLLGQRILISQQQFDDDNITTPNNLSQ